MNELIGLRTNPYHLKLKEKGLTRLHEIVFICAEADYKLSNDAEIVRERKLSNFRISVQDDEIDKIIEMLRDIKEAERDDLQ